MASIDKDYILRKRELIIRSCFTNGVALATEAEILIRNKRYARAHFLCITALEEFAKAYILLHKKIDIETLKALTSHQLKAREIAELVAELLQQELGIKTKESSKIMQASRIHEMRQDTLYVRLLPTKYDAILPDNTYWKKRALNFFGYLRLLDRRAKRILAKGIILRND